MRLVHYPFLSSQAELDDLYHRACWYLPDMREHTVVFPFHAPPSPGQPIRPGAPPEGFGTGVEPQFRTEFPVIRDNPAVMALLNRADVLLLWRDELNKMERYNLSGLARRLFNVSKASREWRLEAYHNAILRHELTPAGEREKLVSANHAKLVAIKDELATRTAYVFGTGPSLEQAMDMDVSGALRIVCNTTVRNKALLEHLRPQIIVAADPALHYGVSRYAVAFREHLEEAMHRHGSYLFMPMGYYPLFVRHYPHLAPRTVGVPVVPAQAENISWDLVERFQIACYANILTLFLMPLGATLAEEIRVVGCDGRNPLPSGDDANPSPFWQHHKDSEFEDIYDTLKQCHPSFFMRNYTDWYSEHCEGVRLVTEKLEQAGREVSVVTPSYIPCLAQRLTPEHRETCLRALDSPGTRDATPESSSDYVFVHDTRSKSSYKVSIFVSLYTAERFMAPLLQNLFAQTLYHQGELEILLIDSASPERERETFLALAREHPHVFYGRTRMRETVYGAFNRGVRESRGEYLMNLGSDNRFRADGAELLAQALDNRPDVGVVYGNHYVTLFENESFHDHVKYGRLSRPRFSRDMMLHKFYFGSELMWRRELHDKVGFYDDSYIVAGDYEMVCRFATVTDFLHLDRYFALYQKNLEGVELSNLERCRAEDERIRETYAQAFPTAVDPPRVHVHYPVHKRFPSDYLTIVCHAMSFDKPVTRSVLKIVEHLEYPFILYCLEQNSSQATSESMAWLIAEGHAVSADYLAPSARALFESRIAYSPALRFLLLAHGETQLMDKNFLSMNRPQLTTYFREAHEKLTAPLRTPDDGVDPLKISTLCDHHELNRLDLAPHLGLNADGTASGAADADLCVFIQHYCPAGQEETYREALKRCIASVREQEHDFAVRVVISDDGSPWSAALAELPGKDPARLIRAFDKNALARLPEFKDIDADLYLYKPRTGYFSKGVLWNAAVSMTRSERLLFLDDDHHFLRQNSLAAYMALLERYELVVGNTREYVFRDVDAVRHTLKLGYESPVVQGSNFALRRELLARAGGFDTRTFLWGTGDDPALFWSLYRLLRPETPQAPRRACYAEGIVTENPYSGRWREDCRVDLELFMRDFLRLHGVHPNNNPSRDRKTWMDRIPDPALEADIAKKPKEFEATEADEAPVLTVVLPTTGASSADVWKSAVALLDQRLAEPHRVVVAAGPDFPPADAALFPQAVEIVPVAASSPGLAVHQALAACETPFAGWITPGDLPGEKLLKGALTFLRETGADIAYGASARFDGRGLRLTHAQPPDMNTATVLEVLSRWQPGQPVFGKTPLLRESPPEAQEDASWDLRLLLRAALKEGRRILAKDQIFSIHRGDAPAPLQPDRAARLVQECCAENLSAMLAGGIAALGTREGERCESSPGAGESRRIIPWCKDVQARLEWLWRVLSRPVLEKRERGAIFGADRDGELLLSLFWPQGLQAVCFLDDTGAEHLAGLPVLRPEEAAGTGFDAVVPSSPKNEERLSRLSPAV